MVRAPSIPTVKALFAVSGNVCAFPECDRPLVDQSSNVVIGEVCHIEAASPGGPRYDSQQSEDERQGFANLVLMCASHHKIIDERVSDFPVERLREIKKRHETKHQRTVSTLNDVSAQNLIRNSVVLGSVVQTVNQSGGQAAHVIVNPPMQVKEPELIPRIHSFNPNPGQLHAFCLHIENQGDATADQIQIQVEHNEVALPCFSRGGFWEMGPSHRPYTFWSTGSIHPHRNERVFQVGFQQDPNEFVFSIRIWARNYLPTQHKISFSRDESQRRMWKDGPKVG